MLRCGRTPQVRLKKGGKRFEIACYPNKVMDWRKKVYVQCSVHQGGEGGAMYGAGEVW